MDQQRELLGEMEVGEDGGIGNWRWVGMEALVTEGGGDGGIGNWGIGNWRWWRWILNTLTLFKRDWELNAMSQQGFWEGKAGVGLEQGFPRLFTRSWGVFQL